MSAPKPLLTAEILQDLPAEALWPDRPTAADVNKLPNCAAVYLLMADASVPVQLATTQQLRRLARARLLDVDPEARGRTDLAAVTRGIRWREVDSAFEARWWYYLIARRMYPRHYRRMISFGPAWFLHIDWKQQVPDIDLTERIWQVEGECVGPWPTHDQCQKALDGLRDLFDLCRYPEQVRRAPQGVSCAYAEMGRCDAPCDGSIPMERYRERCREAWRFACGETRPWIDAAKDRMRRAAEAQAFELAGQVKQQVAFAWKWHDQWLSNARPERALNYLLLLPSQRRKGAKPLLFRQGTLIAGALTPARRLAKEANRWVDAALRSPPPEIAPPIRTEQTWLLAHFLLTRDAAQAFVRRLDGGDSLASLEAQVAGWAAERWPAKKEEAAAAESPQKIGP